MPAFNARFRMKEIAGIPVAAAVSLIVSLMFGLFTMPTWGSILGYLLLAAFILGIFTTIVFIATGEERPFLRFRLSSLRDMNTLTSETVETE